MDGSSIKGLVPGEPLPLTVATVAPSQTNALGHLRAAAYVQLFDDAIPAFFTLTGIADADLRHGDTSPFLMDLHACYLSELGAGEVVRISARHLDHDPRRARLILFMHAVADNRLASTVELLLINMHVVARKPVPWSKVQLNGWLQLASAHSGLPMPRQAGRSIGALNPV